MPRRRSHDMRSNESVHLNEQSDLLMCENSRNSRRESKKLPYRTNKETRKLSFPTGRETDLIVFSLVEHVQRLKMSNCSLNISAGIQSLQLASLIPTFILGVLGNISVLVMFCRRPRADWTYMNIYITNMAIADCVVLVLLPIRIASYYENTWELFKLWDQSNKELCYVLVSVYYVNMYVSIFTVTAISVVRYVAIKYPMKSRNILSRRNALVVCALIWLVTCSFSAAFHHVDDPKHNNTIKCFQKNKEEELPLAFILVLDIVGFLVPFLIMLFCSLRVIYTLRKQLEIGSRGEKLQCMFIIAANLIVFVVCSSFVVFFPRSLRVFL